MTHKEVKGNIIVEYMDNIGIVLRHINIKGYTLTLEFNGNITIGSSSIKHFNYTMWTELNEAVNIYKVVIARMNLLGVKEFNKTNCKSRYNIKIERSALNDKARFNRLR